MARVSLQHLIATHAAIPAIIYGRVSSPVQLHGEGLARQARGALAWIAKHPEMHIRVDAELEDRARSAWTGDHATKDDAALASILKQVENGQLRPPLLIIMESLDRFSREDKWTANARLSGLVARDIWVATTTDDKIYTRDSDIGHLIMSIVILDAAHEHSQATSARVSATKHARVDAAIAKADKGERPPVIHQNVPAWLRCPDAISTTNRDSRTIEVIGAHAATVLLIYQMGVHRGSDAITRWLIEHQDDHPPFGRSGTWSLRSVKKILRSRAVLGHLESKHGLIRNAYPAIPGLTEKLWLQVQAAQDGRRHAGPGAWKTDKINLLKGIGECAECGNPMRLTEPIPGKGRRYYGCRNHQLLGNKVCANTCNYRQDIIEDAILHRFGLGWLMTETPSAVIDLTMLAGEVSKLKDREKRLAAKLQELDDDDMYTTVMAQLRELRGKRQDAVTRLSAAQKQVTVSQPVAIADVADRAALATALRARLTSVRFGASNMVTIDTPSHVLTVCARVDGDHPVLAHRVTDRVVLRAKVKLDDDRYNEVVSGTMRLLGNAMRIKQSGRLPKRAA